MKRVVSQVRAWVRDHTRSSNCRTTHASLRATRTRERGTPRVIYTSTRFGSYSSLKCSSDVIYLGTQTRNSVHTTSGSFIGCASRRSSARKDGLSYQTFFTSIIVQTIALISTAVCDDLVLGMHADTVSQIHACLDEWKTGAHKTKGSEFTGVAYKPIYERHLANLQAMPHCDKHSPPEVFTEMLGGWIYEDCV